MRHLWQIAVTAALIVLSFDVAAKDGAFRSTKHGDPLKGPQRKLDKPAGSCVQCHDGHLSHRRGASGSTIAAGGSGTESCIGCHALPSVEAGAFPGEAAWTNSSHARERMSRPGSITPASGNPCAACHDPHGVRDSRGVIPALLAERETALCTGCHDGSRGADIRGELLKPFWHGQTARGEHDPAEARAAEFDPSHGTPAGRHVTCSDCHNAHLARADGLLQPDGEASTLLSGVARVQVVHGAAGTQPAYRRLAADDLSPTFEYEICFRCHSSATKLPPQAEDIARTTNPQNASFHPIQAAGRNAGIDARAFTDGVSAESRIRCTDCHGSDSARIRGLHGSSYEHLLRKRYDSESSAPMLQTDLCFDCHAWQVYGSSVSEPAELAASRFNAPSEPGHAFHVGSQRIHCAACHDPHGSVNRPALIALRTRPGIIGYTQTPGGGTCTPTCHTTRSYKVNYPR